MGGGADLWMLQAIYVQRNVLKELTIPISGAMITKIDGGMTMFGMMNYNSMPDQFAPAYWHGNGLTLSYTFLPG